MQAHLHIRTETVKAQCSYIVQFSANVVGLLEVLRIWEVFLAYDTDHWLLLGMFHLFVQLQPQKCFTRILCVERYTQTYCSRKDYFHTRIFEVRGNVSSLWTNMSNTLPELYESRLWVSLYSTTIPGITYCTVTKEGCVPSEGIRCISRVVLENKLDINTIGQVLASKLKKAFLFCYMWRK